MSKADIFRNILNEFESDDLRMYCEDMIEMIDPFIITTPSSTSMKYHNETQCSPGGQSYHVIMVGTIMNYILGLDYVRAKFKEPKKRDCLRIAALLHDSIKCGWNGSTYTVFDHPRLAKEWIIRTKPEHDIKQGLKNYIGDLVESHSGQWNTDKRGVFEPLPTPQNDEQFVVHLADYLASRSNIDMIYTEEEHEAINGFIVPSDPKKVKMTFGKYKDMEVGDVPIDYLQWCLENTKNLNPTLKKAIEIIVKG